MEQHVLKGEPDIPLIVRSSARARRITLRISQHDGRVSVTLPKGVAAKEAVSFATQKEKWIRKHLAARPDEVVVALNQALPIENVPHLLVPGTGRAVQVRGDQLLVPELRTGAHVLAYLKFLARDRLTEACDRYAAKLGRAYTSLSLRDTRSRWGSCSSGGRLMFSWRLIMAPPDVLNYVAAHEVSHLAQMNHSSAFWAEVMRIHGPYQKQRIWLRENGALLHRYRFDD